MFPKINFLIDAGSLILWIFLTMYLSWGCLGIQFYINVTIITNFYFTESPFITPYVLQFGNKILPDTQTFYFYLCLNAWLE